MQLALQLIAYLQRCNHTQHEKPYRNGAPDDTCTASVVEAEAIGEQDVLPRGLQDGDETNDPEELEVTAQLLSLAHSRHVGAIDGRCAFLFGLRLVIVVVGVDVAIEGVVVVRADLRLGSSTHICGASSSGLPLLRCFTSPNDWRGGEQQQQER